MRFIFNIGRIGFLVLATTSCSSLFYQPDRSLYYLPSQVGVQATEVRFRAQDGVILVGWHLVPPKDIKRIGTIIQFHGNGENISSHFLSLAWLTSQGFGIFIFDYRGYGKSQDLAPTQKGTYLDSRAALSLGFSLHQEAGGGMFIPYGQSLGGAIMVRALMDFEHRDQISLVVMDSSFLSYKDVARRFLASHPVTWPLSPLGMLLVSDEYAAEDGFKEFKYPLLVIHDKKDPVVPFGAGQELFNQSTSSHKQFWELDEGKHIGVFSGAAGDTRRAEFMKRLNTLVATSSL